MTPLRTIQVIVCTEVLPPHRSLTHRHGNFCGAMGRIAGRFEDFRFNFSSASDQSRADGSQLTCTFGLQEPAVKSLKWSVGKPKRKLTAQQRAEKKRRRQEYTSIFIRGQQKRIRRPPMIDGVAEEEIIRSNADDLWHHENEMWDEIELDEDKK